MRDLRDRRARLDLLTHYKDSTKDKTSVGGALIKEDLLKRLVYAKYIFFQGCEAIERKLSIADGMAVLNFQDAIEMILRTIAEDAHANIKEKMSFDQIIQEIDAASAKKIPYKSSLIQMNKARVNFKHFGLIPARDDVEKCRRDVESFFKESIKLFFDVDFYQVSLADMVEKRRVKNYLKRAEKELDAGNYEQCIYATAIAFQLIFLMPLKYKSSLDRIDSLRIDYKVGRELGNLPKIIKAISANIERHEQEINILIYGINLAEYKRFQFITPHINVFTGGSFEIIKRSDDFNTLENALFCLRFVIDSALLVEQNRIPDKMEMLHEGKLPRYKVVRQSPILTGKIRQDPEHIRDAEIDEILTGYFKSHNIGGYVAILQDDEIAYIEENAVEELPEGK